ncbi:MAG: hypothetical protein ABI675_27400 [Chitinophagaceae bacterium]
MKTLAICMFSIILSIAGKEKGILQINSTTFTDSLPHHLKGDFTDDYGIRYSINDSIWVQHPNIKYHIIRCNKKEQYLIARNDLQNPSEAGLYTRIDYMSFSNMAPWLWGFCLTAYNAKTDSLAETAAQADRKNPKKGCNGFPFSRMKKT